MCFFGGKILWPNCSSIINIYDFVLKYEDDLLWELSLSVVKVFVYDYLALDGNYPCKNFFACLFCSEIELFELDWLLMLSFLILV